MSDPTPLDSRIVKEELFDVDAMNALTVHDGLSHVVKQKLKLYRKMRYDLNKVKVVYNWGKEWIKKKVGRLSSSGLQGIDREVRAALASKYYWDLDMENSQPVLLTQISKKNGWACPLLEEYVAFRNEKREALMLELGISLADTKDVMLSTLFGGKVGWRMNSPYLIALGAELETIMNNIVAHRPDIYDQAVHIKKEFPKRTTLAVYIQDEERKVLERVDSILAEMGRRMDVLIHDGGLVRKLPNELEFPEDIIRAVEVRILSEMGYAIKLAIKPLKSSIEFTAKQKKYTPASVIVSDSYAAKKFVELLGDNIILDKDAGRFVFDTEVGMWTNEEASLKRWLNHFAHELIFYQMGEVRDKIYDYSGAEKNIKNMISNIDRHLTPQNFFEKKGDSAIGKFLFADGIYDMKTREFKSGFDSSILFFHRIVRNYGGRNEALIEKVNTLLFRDPFLEEQEEQATFFKRGIARALYGDYRNHKNCYITVGKPNCGRGLLTRGLSAAFGDYVGTFNANNLLFNPRSGADESKKMAWLVHVCNARIVIANEISISPGKFVDGNLLKSLVGGGDTIKARLNFKEDVSHVIRSILFVLGNDIPPIKPAEEAVLNRVFISELEKCYVEEPEEGNRFQMKQDSSLKNLFNDDTYCDALFHLIVDFYHEWVGAGSPTAKPLCSKEAASQWVEGGVSISSLLSDAYEITTNEEDIVPVRDIIKYLQGAGCLESETKIGRTLNDLKIGKADIKVSGKTIRVRTCIRKLQEAEETLIV